MSKSPSTINIRRAALKDLPEIQALYVATIKNTCTQDYNQQQIAVWTSSVENRERWETAITTQYFLVAEIGRKIVGFASLREGDYLDFLYVHHLYLRQGIAGRLFGELEKEWHRSGSKNLTSDVSKTARPFFESKSFRVVKENRRMMKGVGITNYNMVKRKGA